MAHVTFIQIMNVVFKVSVDGIPSLFVKIYGFL
jgi:hypothetical protein